jgi:hypothetical protein
MRCGDATIPYARIWQAGEMHRGLRTINAVRNCIGVTPDACSQRSVYLEKMKMELTRGAPELIRR